MWWGLLSSPRSCWQFVQLQTSKFITFFVVSILLLSLSQVVYFQVKIVPSMVRELHTIEQDILTAYPQGLIVAWNGERLSSSIEQPVRIDYPAVIKNQEIPKPAHLATFYPQADTVNDTNDDRQTNWFVITATQLAAQNQQSQWSSIPLVDILGEEQFEISPETLPNHLSGVHQRALDILSTLQLIAWLIIPLIFILGHIWLALIHLVFLYFLFKVQEPAFSFEKAWRLSLLITLVATLVEQAGIWVYQDMTASLFTITYLVLASTVWWTRRSDQAA